MISEISSVLSARQSAILEKTSGGGAGFSETLRNSSEVDLDAIFSAASERYGIPVNLLKAVAKAESGFRPDAVSRCGAMGIMQLMPGTAKSLGVTDAYDPVQNIMGGAKYLSQMLDSFDGSVPLALAAYNAGPGAVSKYGGIPPFEETQNYVRNVLGNMGMDISAGTVAYGGRFPGSRRASATAGSSGSVLYGEGISEMLLMRVLEMQMKSDDDDKDGAYRKIF